MSDLHELRTETRDEILDCLNLYDEIQGTECSLSVETLIDALRAERAEVATSARLVTETQQRAHDYAREVTEECMSVTAERDATREQLQAFAVDLRAALSDAATVRIALGCLMNEHPAFSGSTHGRCTCCCCRQALAALGDTFKGQPRPPCQVQMPIADQRAEVLAELAETRESNGELRDELRTVTAERDALRHGLECVLCFVGLHRQKLPAYPENFPDFLALLGFAPISQKANTDG